MWTSTFMLIVDFKCYSSAWNQSILGGQTCHRAHNDFAGTGGSGGQMIFGVSDLETNCPNVRRCFTTRSGP